MKKLKLPLLIYISEKKKFNDCIKFGWITTSGKYLSKFEKEIKKLLKQYCYA